MLQVSRASHPVGSPVSKVIVLIVSVIDLATLAKGRERLQGNVLASALPGRAPWSSRHMNSEATDVTRQRWVDAFVAYVLGRVPAASPRLLAARAEILYPCLGRFHPAEAAEADWSDLPLPTA